MTTYAVNNLAQKLGNRLPVPYPVDQSGVATFNQGDLVYFTTANGFLKALDSDAHAAGAFVGVAQISSALALYANTQTQAAEVQIEPMAGVGFGDVYLYTGTAGETYAHGQAVYFGTSAQTVQKTTGSNAVGYVWLPLGGTLSGAVPVPILIAANFPIAAI